MTTLATALAVTLVTVASLVVGAAGLRLSRTTSDFYVASRAVGPALNASAISGEYLSAASFLGVAGLVLLHGVDMLWYPVGYTAGYLLLLVFVAAPLRRSRAYTVPDFAEFRLESLGARQVATVLVVAIGMLYVVPQFQGAGLTLTTLTDAPTWLGAVIVALTVLANVVAGGMRSITLSQAFQYWLKLFALLLPVFFLLPHAGHHRAAHWDASSWAEPLQGRYALYLTYSIIVATFLGAMGLPHVVVRFYTNRDGRAARRTTVAVLCLLGIFYLLPTVYGVLGRMYAPDLIAHGRTDSVVLELPGRLLHGPLSDLLTALLGAGAFAAFLSTTSGLIISVGGVVAQDLAGHRLGPVAAFRVSVTAATAVTLALAVAAAGVAVAHAVELAFAVAASTLCPLLVLGIWWRGLTSPGAVAGMLAGGVASGSAVLAVMLGATPGGWWGAVVNQPALCTVPLGFATMIAVSLLTPGYRPAHVARTMVRLHAPDEIELDRGSYHPETARHSSY
jgi:Na+(H+)/acetate symporter ActP